MNARIIAFLLPLCLMACGEDQAESEEPTPEPLNTQALEWKEGDKKHISYQLNFVSIKEGDTIKTNEVKWERDLEVIKIKDNKAEIRFTCFEGPDSVAIRQFLEKARVQDAHFYVNNWPRSFMAYMSPYVVMMDLGSRQFSVPQWEKSRDGYLKALREEAALQDYPLEKLEDITDHISLNLNSERQMVGDFIHGLRPLIDFYGMEYRENDTVEFEAQWDWMFEYGRIGVDLQLIHDAQAGRFDLSVANLDKVAEEWGDPDSLRKVYQEAEDLDSNSRDHRFTKDCYATFWVDTASSWVQKVEQSQSAEDLMFGGWHHYTGSLVIEDVK